MLVIDISCRFLSIGVFAVSSEWCNVGLFCQGLLAVLPLSVCCWCR